VNSDPTADHDLEVFFDGGCPLCRREIGLLQKWDRRRKIRFTDIDAPGFRAEDLGKSHEEFMSKIYGRLRNGTWIQGVEVFRRMYGAVGFGWIVAVTRWPGISHLMDAGYRVFAQNRLRLTGRCHGDACKLQCNSSLDPNAQGQRAMTPPRTHT